MRWFRCMLLCLTATAAGAAPVRGPAVLLQSEPRVLDRPALIAIASGALAVLGGLTILTIQQHKVAVKPEYSRGPMAAFEMKF